MKEEKEVDIRRVVSINETRIRAHLDMMVRRTVDEALDELLKTEAEALCGAWRHGSDGSRQALRTGRRRFEISAQGEDGKPKAPRLGKHSETPLLVKRHPHRKASVEEALIEMYLAKGSRHRIEEVTRALWGGRVSSRTMNDFIRKILRHMDRWRRRPLKGKYSHIYLGGLLMKRTWGDEVKNVSVMAALGSRGEGYCEVLAVSDGSKEVKASWQTFLSELKQRDLEGVRFVVSDKCLGLADSSNEIFPPSRWQRSFLYFAMSRRSYHTARLKPSRKMDSETKPCSGESCLLRE